VILDPGDSAAWAGLALTGGLGAEPEIVAAAYLALDDRKVDPVTLAGWLSS
jgi:hypothetical protein